MPHYRYRSAHGLSDEITVIDDRSMCVEDQQGNWSPGFRFVDDHTVRAHPLIIDVLLLDSERLWSLEDVLGVLQQ